MKGRYYKLNKKCKKCGRPIIDKNKSGFCNHHRDRTGKNNPFYGKKHKRETIEKAKRKLSKISKNLWQDPVYRQKVIAGVSKPRKESFRKEQSERIKQWYQNNPEQREIRSEHMKRSWADGKIEPNINSMNESKLERELKKEIMRLLPNRNVRKTTIRINKKWFYPDVRVDEDIIIEFYGDYWHANPKIFKAENIFHHGLTAKQIWGNDKKRIKILEDSGFKVFIIWQDEYQNNKKEVINNLINKI